MGLVLAGCQSSPPRASQPRQAAAIPLANPPRNVILFLGDGMGPEAVKAASLFATGEEEGGLAFHAFPNQATMTHHSASSEVTDSAASATAIATGRKVDNTVVSLALPGDGTPLLSLLELYKAQGKAVGMVTTAFVEDATPAAFAAHRARRSQFDGIAADYLEVSRPDLIMGGFTGGGFEPAVAEQGGYQVVTTRQAMEAITSVAAQPMAGLFGKGPLPSELDGDYSAIPKLSQMTAKALTLLDDDPQGFFLLVENENIDEAGHHNNIERSVAATVELSESVRVALEWAGHRQDTLFLVTADHETGGLKVGDSRGQGEVPEATWSTSGHTAEPVRVFARGPLSEGFRGQLDNTDIVRLLTGKPLN